jgi:hypothetical protein
MAGRRAHFDGIIISHLGNIDGRNPDKENNPVYVEKALKAGWHVCVNVFFVNGGFILPHAGGNSPMPPSFFSKPRVWARAFNTDTADALCNINAHSIMFTGEFPALTSAQFIWTPPPHTLTARAIAYLPEIEDNGWLDLAEPAGLCSNEPASYI